MIFSERKELKLLLIVGDIIWINVSVHDGSG